MTGDCYQYCYGGPGPDIVSVVLLSQKGQEGFFKNLDSDYPEPNITEPLDSKTLTLCGPENWMSLMRSTEDKVLRQSMAEAYAQQFDCDLSRVLQRATPQGEQE